MLRYYTLDFLCNESGKISHRGSHRESKGEVPDDFEAQDLFCNILIDFVEGRVVIKKIRFFIGFAANPENIG